MAQPGGDAASPFAILGFLTAVGAAMRDILSRKVPPHTPALIVTFSTLFIVMMSAVIMSALLETQVAPTFRHGWLMFIAGFFLTCGHAFVFMAYRMAPARVVAPFNYSFMIWAGLSGLLVFHEVPNDWRCRHAAHHGGGPRRRACSKAAPARARLRPRPRS